VRDLQDKDKRRLYLLSEGNIPSTSPLYDQLVASEIKLREESARQRLNVIKGNPSLHLSLTRLSIRNLSHNITSKALKALARKAVVGFATDVKMGVRQPLSKEEIQRGGPILKEAEKARKAKGKGVVKQAKVIFEGKEGRKVSETSGAGRSRGYGFIEYTSHRWALMGLRWLNGRALDEITEHGRGPHISREEFKDQKRRLIVEFAIENSQVTGRRQEREIKARERSQVACAERESGKLTGSHGRALSENQEGAKMRRKRQGTESSQNNAAIKPALQKSHVKEQRSDAIGDDNKLMRRQRIIGKKRMIRKSRKST
jgi:nucleolar protein 4